MNIWRLINFLRELTDDLHSLSRATKSRPKDAHVQQICDSSLRITFRAGAEIREMFMWQVGT